MVLEIAAIINAYENATGEKPRLYMSEKTLRDVNRELECPECYLTHLYKKRDFDIVWKIDGCHVGIDNRLEYGAITVKRDFDE